MEYWPVVKILIFLIIIPTGHLKYPVQINITEDFLAPLMM